MPESSVVQEVQKPEGQPQSSEVAPGQPRSVREDWKEFSSRVTTKGSQGTPEQKEHVDLKELTPEQLEHWKKTGEGPEPKQEKEPESTEGKTEAKAEKKDGEGDAKPAGKTETQTQTTGYDRLLERASKEPDFDKVVERLHEPFFPLSREGYARYQTMAYAMGQISNREDVLYFLARPENSSVALSMQNAEPYKIAKTIHMISAELRFGARTTKRADAEETRPRAPRPPSEVGGRGTSPADPEKEALRNNDFKTLEGIWNRKAKATGKR